MNRGLAVEDLSVSYGSLSVVRGLNVRVDRGEVVALLGPNGAGKTTSLMAMAGFLPDTTGSVTIDNQRVSGPSYLRCRKQMGIVLEGRSVVPSLTVAQNLSFAQIDVHEGTAMFPELRQRLDVRAGNLSGGEQQMLALARAVGRRPRVLLIDELSFGLAPITCGRLFAALRTVVEQHELTVLLVEQHIHYARQVADRAIVMVSGEVVMEMPTSDIPGREEELERFYLGGAR
jgi:branched-chain amino acid transport system ATP-binding protein